MVLVEAHLLCSFLKHNTNNKTRENPKRRPTSQPLVKCRSPDKIRSYHVTISITVKYDYMSFITRNLGKRGLVKRPGERKDLLTFNISDK